jgi:hypothetical protein
MFPLNDGFVNHTIKIFDRLLQFSSCTFRSHFTSFEIMSNFDQHTNLAVDAIKAGLPTLKKVQPPTVKPLPTAEQIAAARANAENEPEPIPVEFLPKTGDGRTHLDLIKEGCATLKKVDVQKERSLPTAEEIAAAKALAENEPEVIPVEFLPKTGDGRTHLDLIKTGAVQLKKVDIVVTSRLPTAEEIEAERAAIRANL